MVVTIKTTLRRYFELEVLSTYPKTLPQVLPVLAPPRGPGCRGNLREGGAPPPVFGWALRI